jgi:hypothetical protein
MNERPNWFASAFRFVKTLTGLPGRSARIQSVPAAAANASDGAENPTLGDAGILTEPEINVANVAAEVRTDATPPDQQERERRRDLIRQLFNDFWTGGDEKPATFAKRLDAAEPYINIRLAACDADWRLDAATRQQLGLPVSSTAQS